MKKNPDSFTLEKKTNIQNRPKSQLQEEHKQCLIEFYDDDPGAYIQDAVEMLISKFAGLEIKKSRVYGLMRDDCNLSFKKVTFWSEARASSDTIQKRYDWSSHGVIHIWIFLKTAFLSMKLTSIST